MPVVLIETTPVFRDKAGRVRALAAQGLGPLSTFGLNSTTFERALEDLDAMIKAATELRAEAETFRR